MGLIWQRGVHCALLATLVAATATAQDRAPTIEARLSDPVYMSWVSNEDVSTCISCHYEGPNVAQILGDQGSKLTAFSRRKELEFWLSNDKHTIARRRVEPFTQSRTKAELNALLEKLDNLSRTKANQLREAGFRVDTSQIGLTEFPTEWIGESNFLSRRICDKLWGTNAVDGPDGYAKFRDNCLTCHGGYQTGDSGFDLSSAGDAQLGIDCLYCHQVGDNTRWVAAHSAPDSDQTWRLLPPEQKTSAGMRHLVGTSNQANLCFDCHVGNRSKNMFVTHEMYAAGHPPIPSIELQTFCQKMPQHWQTPSQLYESLSGYEKRDQYFKTNYPGVVESTSPGETFWNTRKMLIGALAARKKSLDLVIDSANPHQWADYSLYDCAACHHELQSESQRQMRGFPAAPGRPRQHEWPKTLLEIAYIFYGKQTLATTRQLESQLTTELSEQPFGDPRRVKPAAEALRDQVVAAIGQVESQVVDARVAKAVFRGLARSPENELLTYDSARQVVWAMHTIAAELSAEGFPLSPPIAALVESLGKSETAGIESQLPSGRKQFIYSEALEADLQRRASFSPRRLKTRLNEINQLLE